MYPHWQADRPFPSRSQSDGYGPKSMMHDVNVLSGKSEKAVLLQSLYISWQFCYLIERRNARAV